MQSSFVKLTSFRVEKSLRIEITDLTSKRAYQILQRLVLLLQFDPLPLCLLCCILLRRQLFHHFHCLSSRRFLDASKEATVNLLNIVNTLIIVSKEPRRDVRIEVLAACLVLCNDVNPTVRLESKDLGLEMNSEPLKLTPNGKKPTRAKSSGICLWKRAAEAVLLVMVGRSPRGRRRSEDR